MLESFDDPGIHCIQILHELFSEGNFPDNYFYTF